MHAICDALFGALGKGDIGEHFPNSDPRWRNVPSRTFLEEAARQIADCGGRLVNVDASLIAERPKIAPHVPAMKQNIALALGIPPGQVGVKATTNEGLGFVGREEGMAAFAVACVEVKE
jgi:2-C-methyl-D-erythritol 2,4-cyclodiphosphate synthase